MILLFYGVPGHTIDWLITGFFFILAYGKNLTHIFSDVKMQHKACGLFFSSSSLFLVDVHLSICVSGFESQWDLIFNSHSKKTFQASFISMAYHLYISTWVFHLEKYFFLEFFIFITKLANSESFIILWLFCLFYCSVYQQVRI